MNDAFFYHILKPGRYLGGECKTALPSAANGQRTVVLVYPGRYESAMADPGWRRLYFQISQLKDVQCVRAIDFGRDLWDRIEAGECVPFAIDGQLPLKDADELVFWITDAFTAASIPCYLKRLRLSNGCPRIGVCTDGSWAPRFLAGHVDWVSPAPGGWLTSAIADRLKGFTDQSNGILDGQKMGEWDQYWVADREIGLLNPVSWPVSPQMVSRVDIGDEYIDIDLCFVDEQGMLRRRARRELTDDAREGLRCTGIDGLRFCGCGPGDAAMAVACLTDLTRIFHTRYVRVECPIVETEEFEDHWASFKPHFIKPSLRLRVDRFMDIDQLIDIGRRALNSGWQTLSAVLTFDSFDDALAVVEQSSRIIRAWHQATEGFSDKRLIRLEYEPASPDRWADPPSFPSEDEWRRYASAFRHFKDAASNLAFVGTFRLEDVLSRNWLLAAGPNIWTALGNVDISAGDDMEAPGFDWFAWLRQLSGLTGPSLNRFSTVAPLAVPELHSDFADVQTPVVTAGEQFFGRRKRRPAFSRRLSAPQRQRMRVHWGKQEYWRLYSHLDMVRAIERAIRRAELPVSYSEGFHPRMKVSFGPPLPFGLISESEFFDLALDEDYRADFAERLKNALPDGVDLVAAAGMPTNMPSLSEAINEQELCALIPLGVSGARDRIAQFEANSSIRWQRPDRPDRKPVDPRRSLREVSIDETPEGTLWTLRVAVGGEGSIRPADWCTLLFQFSPDDIARLIIVRKALWVRRGARLRSPFDVV